MLSNKRIKRWSSALLAVVLCLSAVTSVSASRTSKPLPKPSWQKDLSEVNQFIEAPFHIPSTKTVYLASNTYIASQTKVWEAGVVTAVDESSGKPKWSFTFYQKGTPYPWNTKIAYSKEGSVYALVKDGQGTKLFSVNASGKSNWTIPVPNAEDVHVMNDGTILLIDPDRKVTPTAKSKPRAYAYSANGKKLAELSLGQMYSVIGGQYVVSQIGEIGKSNLAVYGSKLNKLFTYNLPSGAVTYVNEATWVINNRDILLRVNVPKSGNKLIAMNAKGKTLWERSIPGNARVQSIGQNYVVYADGVISLFNAQGLVTKAEVKVDLPIAIIFETPDQQIEIHTENAKKVLNAKTLQTIYEYPNDQDRQKYHYVGNGYLYSINQGNQLAQYKLQK
ncbi:outer membrane protein assembly factor BamB family protein [Paenibacillus popilliae]|uniref:outer membrane protein assembly factor BamB family protein n=1 Tax=Paenibacillus popilliae TaxID=78057 RepID=UPI00163C74D2|nr:PQQ-binding-like beta-propeller repeat protein [Paenibacillus sp. SDF0028]